MQVVKHNNGVRVHHKIPILREISLHFSASAAFQVRLVASTYVIVQTPQGSSPSGAVGSGSTQALLLSYGHHSALTKHPDSLHLMLGSRELQQDETSLDENHTHESRATTQVVSDETTTCIR